MPERKKIFHVYSTPVNPTFESLLTDDCLVFTGTGDSKISPENLNRAEAASNYRIIRIQDANHSLEVEDTIKSVEILENVMLSLKEYMNHAKGEGKL